MMMQYPNLATKGPEIHRPPTFAVMMPNDVPFFRKLVMWKCSIVPGRAIDCPIVSGASGCLIILRDSDVQMSIL